LFAAMLYSAISSRSRSCSSQLCRAAAVTHSGMGQRDGLPSKSPLSRPAVHQLRLQAHEHRTADTQARRRGSDREVAKGFRVTRIAGEPGGGGDVQRPWWWTIQADGGPGV
jgi:hypothetical protein